MVKVSESFSELPVIVGTSHSIPASSSIASGEDIRPPPIRAIPADSIEDISRVPTGMEMECGHCRPVRLRPSTERAGTRPFPSSRSSTYHSVPETRRRASKCGDIRSPSRHFPFVFADTRRLVLQALSVGQPSSIHSRISVILHGMAWPSRTGSGIPLTSTSRATCRCDTCRR